MKKFVQIRDRCKLISRAHLATASAFFSAYISVRFSCQLLITFSPFSKSNSEQIQCTDPWRFCVNKYKSFFACHKHWINHFTNCTCMAKLTFSAYRLQLVQYRTHLEIDSKKNVHAFLFFNVVVVLQSSYSQLIAASSLTRLISKNTTLPVEQRLDMRKCKVFKNVKIEADFVV